MNALALPKVHGKLTADAPLAPLVWFKSGGAAQWLFEPKDLADLQGFLRDLDPPTPVMALGLGSNMIVRDGGVSGVVIRLGKAFAKCTARDEVTLDCGGGASGILVSSTARDAGIAGLEFLRSIPGTVGGFVRMNGGAYGSEVADILIDCDVVLRNGALVTLPVSELGYTYRHSELPVGAIVVVARFRGRLGDPAAIQAEMDRISAAREASQPLRSKTGGSTLRTRRATRPGNWSMRPGVGVWSKAARKLARNTAISCSIWAVPPAPISKVWARKCGGGSRKNQGSNWIGKSSASAFLPERQSKKA